MNDRYLPTGTDDEVETDSDNVYLIAEGAMLLERLLACEDVWGLTNCFEDVCRSIERDIAIGKPDINRCCLMLSAVRSFMKASTGGLMETEVPPLPSILKDIESELCAYLTGHGLLRYVATGELDPALQAARDYCGSHDGWPSNL